MPISIVIHIQNSEPVLGEIEELPAPNDRYIKVSNPRHLDGKDLNYILGNVDTVLWMMDKINFIEVLPGEEEEEVIGFVRE